MMRFSAGVLLGFSVCRVAALVAAGRSGPVISIEDVER